MLLTVPSFYPQQEISFMPSIGVEFVTQMGVHIPEFVIAGVEMHTSIYHESALHAKVAMSNNEVKLTIPAPQGTTRLLGIRYGSMFLDATVFITEHHLLSFSNAEIK